MQQDLDRITINTVKQEKVVQFAKERTKKHKSVCVWCQKSNEGRLKKCGRCRSCYYCDSVCQKLHWSEHKRSCYEYVN